MNAIITSQPTTPRNVVRLLQTLFTVLACASLVVGSALISIVCFSGGIGGDPVTMTAKFVYTLILLMPTLFSGWLFGMAALLTARRWVGAGLSLPVALGVFLSFYLFIVFVIPHVPAPTVVFVALLVPLNGVAIWLARRFLDDTIQ